MVNEYFLTEKNRDESTNSTDASSNEDIDEIEMELPEIVVTSDGTPHQVIEAPDPDEDEAFISELLAIHPNDDDLIVEDLEAVENVPQVGEMSADARDREEAAEFGVRLNRVLMVWPLSLCCRCCLLRSLFYCQKFSYVQY